MGKIKVKFNKSQHKNLVSRKMHKILNKIIENKVASEYEMKTRIALEELAEKLKNEGVSAWEGQSYILKIK